MSASIRLRDVGVSRERRPVVHGVSVEVPRGGWLAVIGPNGAGKSTLLKAVAGLLPHTGLVEVDGRDVGTLSRRDLGRGIAYTAQHPVVPPQMTVRDYVLLGRTPHLGYLARPGRRDRAVCDTVLDRLGLAPFAVREVGRLSGGERQRVVLARALAQQAPVLLLDEPTSALDLGHQQQAMETVDGLRRDDGLTVITTLHDLGLAAQYADRLLLLAGGRAVAWGTAASVLTPGALAEHYGAHVQVVPGPDGRPQVHLVRPSGSTTAVRPVAGDPATGEPTTGAPIAGAPIAGRPATGDPVASVPAARQANGDGDGSGDGDGAGDAK